MVGSAPLSVKAAAAGSTRLFRGVALEQFQDDTVVMRPDDNRTFVAYLPAIGGCHAWGETPEEARAELANVFDMIAEEYEQGGRPFPPDVELTVAGARSGAGPSRTPISQSPIAV